MSLPEVYISVGVKESELKVLTLPDMYRSYAKSWRINRTPLLILISVLRDKIIAQENRNAFEESLKAGMIKRCYSLIKLSAEFYKLGIEHHYNDESKEKNNIDNMLFRFISLRGLTGEGVNETYDCKLTLNEAKFGAICAAIENRINFLQKKLFHEDCSNIPTWYDEVHGKQSTEFIVRILAPFVQSLIKETANLTYDIRNLLTKARKAGEREIIHKGISNQKKNNELMVYIPFSIDAINSMIKHTNQNILSNIKYQ